MENTIKTDPVLYIQKNGVAFITLNRPKALNALSGKLMEELVLCIDIQK